MFEKYKEIHAKAITHFKKIILKKWKALFY